MTRRILSREFDWVSSFSSAVWVWNRRWFSACSDWTSASASLTGLVSSASPLTKL
jgi:hypothetical protein